MILARRLSLFLTSATNLTAADLRRYQRIRTLLPRFYRRFFEGAPNVPGQMWAFERRLLFNTVRQRRPAVVCESGTWLGGGSTYFIALALRENEYGQLHTTELLADFHERATCYYREHLPQLIPFVRFHEGKSVDIYPNLLPGLPPIDLLLLDGAEDAQETWNEFQLFSPFLAPDATIVAHDWNTEKMALMRPYFERSPEWQLKSRLRAPVSVGMVVLRRSTS